MCCQYKEATTKQTLEWYFLKIKFINGIYTYKQNKYWCILLYFIYTLLLHLLRNSKAILPISTVCVCGLFYRNECLALYTVLMYIDYTYNLYATYTFKNSPITILYNISVMRQQNVTSKTT